MTARQKVYCLSPGQFAPPVKVRAPSTPYNGDD
jgi:hypothetical protein